MSRPVEQTISCPQCGHQQEFTCWLSVNVSLDKDLKKALFGGRLTTFICQHCNIASQVAYDMLYHDMDFPLMVWLKFPNENDKVTVERTPETMFALLGGNYVFRLVKSFQELLEKIKIFDDGFEDFTIELLKLMVCMREGIDITQPLYYDRMERSLLTGNLIVLVRPVGDELIENRYSVKKQLPAVQAIQEEVASVLPQDTERWILLDRGYVLKRLEQSGMMRCLR